MMGDSFCTIYLVRHGESLGNVSLEKWIFEVQKTALGSNLTKLGEKQALAVSTKLKKVHFDAIFSSHLLRAKRTAEIIGQDRKMAVIAKEALQERKKGKLGGKSKEELTKELGNNFLYGNPDALTEEEMWKFRLFEDMESAEEAFGRFITALREIAIAYSGKTVLVVSHGNVMRSLLVHLGYAVFKNLQSGAIENTGYIKLESDGIDFFIKETAGVNKK
jgi:broad specificity phosphatase PhoE